MQGKWKKKENFGEIQIRAFIGNKRKQPMRCRTFKTLNGAKGDRSRRGKKRNEHSLNLWLPGDDDVDRIITVWCRELLDTGPTKERSRRPLEMDTWQMVWSQLRGKKNTCVWILDRVGRLASLSHMHFGPRPSHRRPKFINWAYCWLFVSELGPEEFASDIWLRQSAAFQNYPAIGGWLLQRPALARFPVPTAAIA